MRKILLRHHKSPGDILVLTAAIECLVRQHPGKFRIGIDTSCNSIFQNNPHVESLTGDDVERIECHYNLINRSGQEPRHFMEGFVFDLAERLKINLRLDRNHPALYLSAREKVPPTDLPRPYALINAGTKSDYTCKGAGTRIYQEIVDAYEGKLTFVQIGEAHHLHKPLANCINYIGKTNTRELIRLAYHSVLGVGGVTFLHHIFGAFQKPYVCYAGGREAVSWEQYPSAVMLNTVGQLPCCRLNGCWKSRVVALGDGDAKDKSLCELPMTQENGETIPYCMHLLGSDAAIKAIDAMIISGMVKL